MKEAFKDFVYAICKYSGVIWIVKKMLHLTLKDWVKERDEAFEEPRIPGAE